MSLYEKIQDDYQECIKLLKIDEDLRTALKSHERVPAFLKNLSEQIQNLKPSLQPDRVKLKEIVYSVTETFVYAIKRKADEMQMSDIAKAEAQKKAQELADMDATLAGTPQGVYEEIFSGDKLQS